MDAINACVTKIYSTTNFADEMPYMANVALMNPIDFFVQFVSAKDGEGRALYPTASLFNQVVIGGVLIIPEQSIAVGNVLVADMSRMNVSNYKPYTVKIGYVNDDFIKNQFVILGKKAGKLRKPTAEYNYNALYEVAYQTTLNLNKVIDINFYPTPETKNSNLKHRPIGIGVQGLADTFALMGLEFGNEESKKLNEEIHETIYYAAMEASIDLAKKDGVYSSYEGSPLSTGQFQFNLWGFTDEQLSGLWDWAALRKKLMKHGARNSLLLAPMPTASTAQIMGNNEAFEAFTSNIGTRRTLAGEFITVNKHLVRDLAELGLWSDSMRNRIIVEKGSIQNIPNIPDELKLIYKTVWEISQKTIIDMSADRGKFICQSQSLNLFFRDVNNAKLTSAHFHSWKRGLKTGMYYLRTEAATSAIAGLGVDASAKSQPVIQIAQDDTLQNSNDIICSLDNKDDCLACGS
jgi:ribonucleoside-diphosphate reductase alpha chain